MSIEYHAKPVSRKNKKELGVKVIVYSVLSQIQVCLTLAVFFSQSWDLKFRAQKLYLPTMYQTDLQVEILQIQLDKSNHCGGQDITRPD